MEIKTVPLNIPGAEAFSTKRGDIIDGNPYSGFNACNYSGDSLIHVKSCRKQLCDQIGIGYDELLIPRQTHSTNVVRVHTFPFPEDRLQDVDGLVTKIPGIALAVNTADCVPIVFSDPENKVIGIAHSGWRGTVGRIARRTVQSMCRTGAEIGNIHVAMGPCICRDCYEVSEEFAIDFDKEFPGAGTISKHEGHFFADIAAAIRHTLIDLGIDESRISMPVACSMTDNHDFFSARCLGISSGRTLTVVRLRR